MPTQKKNYEWRSCIIIQSWSPYVNHLYFVPTCPSPKSPGSWLHFLHWMMIFCAITPPIYGHYEAIGKKQLTGEFFDRVTTGWGWNQYQPCLNSCWGHFLLKILSKLSFAPKVFPFASVENSRSCSAFSQKNFLLRSTSQLIDKCRQQRKTYTQVFFQVLAQQ